jgi:hypothetical protein
MASVSGGRARVEAERRQLSPHSGNVLTTVSSIESFVSQKFRYFITFAVFDGWGVCGSSHSKGILKPDLFSNPTVEFCVEG